VSDFDLCGALRRIRRTADLSQRELAQAAGVGAAVISHVEAGRRGMTVDLLSRLASVAGLRLALLDTTGHEVPGMTDGAVRDEGGRRFPAHLDTRYGDVDWWHGRERYSRDQPWYTFDRVRETRDFWRGRLGTPDDHQIPQPGDAPAERRAGGRRAPPPPPQAGPPPGGAAGGRPPPPTTPPRGGPAAMARGAPGPAAGSVDLPVPARVRGAGPGGTAGTRGRLPVWVRCRLIRCYGGTVRGSLLLTRRGEALS
jgi:transcriptional regulator with XRE-family HTH domain